jgi:hypothetical protein
MRHIAAVVLFVIYVAANVSAAPCSQVVAHPDSWIAQRVNLLVRAARATFEDEDRRPRYDRVVNEIAAAINRCQLNRNPELVGRYSQLFEYVKFLALTQTEDHELGFEVSDRQYFAETSAYTTIPDYLLSPGFLRAVSRFETLPKAKDLLRQINTSRAAGEQLLFFSYASRHLGTPDNPNSFRRLLIVVPGNPGQHVPEKWVQFGIADPRQPRSVRNVSVVAVLADTNRTNVYFKDYFRTYRRNGPIAIKGRWELGEGDDPCAECHKSGVLPIFPVAGSVSSDEKAVVEAVNQRFRTYGPASFGGFLDPGKLGPGLGPLADGELMQPTSSRAVDENFRSVSCSSCHQPNGLGSLNWPMDKTLISSFVKGGRMPLNAELSAKERTILYNHIIDDYFSIDDAHPGVLKAWLLGKS